MELYQKGYFMGLFKKKKEEKEFVSKVVICENVNEEILKTAKEYNLPISSLDFEILSYKTYIKFPESDFIEASEEVKKEFEKEENLLNPECEIKQVYEIEIKKYIPKNNFELLGEMSVNNLYTYAEFTVSKKSVIRINDIFNTVKKELNKKKVRNSLLLGFFDLMDEDIKRLQSIILIDEKLNNDFKIRLCKGVEPVKSVEGKVVYHFKKNAEEIKKTLLYPVRMDDVLIEIILPKEGKNGRNCKGKILLEKTPKDFEIPEILYDSKTIEKKKEKDKIVYLAKKDGYILKEDDKFVIKDEMEIKQINIRTGDVKDAKESDIKLKVKEGDVLKEAIADNMTVETTELYVKGNVGKKAKINVKVLEINGQTHKESKIKAQKADINVHKGLLNAKKAKINRLEGGFVRADEVEIDLALGGVVYAKKIKINKMLSHNKFYASELIILCEQKGEENLLAIAPKKIFKDINIEELEKKIKTIEQNINIKTKEYNKLKKVYDENKIAMQEYKQMYFENKKKNIKTSHIILKKLKEFQTLIKNIEKIKSEIYALKEDKDQIVQTLDYLQSGIYNAKILSNTPWIAFNRILFELIEPPVKYVYDTKGNEKKCGFKLKFSGDIIKIVKIKVEDDICN